MSNDISSKKIAFFGTSAFAEIILAELKEKYSIVPSLIITTPDKPVGRKQIMTASPVKIWGEINTIPLLQPGKLRDEQFLKELGAYWDIFIVASYGKIIPQSVLNLPRQGTFNVHPSLLPKYRGASPLQSQILNNEQQIGTTIMLMDAEVDHGPILAQEDFKKDPAKFFSYTELEQQLAVQSAALIVRTLSSYLEGLVFQRDQDHSAATFTKMIEKNDGLINLADEGLKNYLAYLAYKKWPGVFFFHEQEGKQMRVLIKKAEFKEGLFIPLLVVPEGKKEMTYQQFLRS